MPRNRQTARMFTLAITVHNGHRIAELGFAVAAIAGALFALGAVAPGRRGSQLLGGIALAVAGVLLVIAARWGHFG